ncbi:thioredoxin domain-containing protein [Demequina sp. TTPB684]|uniref:DsbA family protein n=1 Tax=unclassified Demequina TaxID=2620311 RepID=UPI001CF57F32|nr:MULTISPECIES: thioredoxin domain-containing protein [unclassified Demequina]MCB2412815.1 thioredoxin domain-containing protein [Demequina sp. TTPB684]UPU87451.1 thioredoxin domain-containing protein [Demequina sp. TMPB413]
MAKSTGASSAVAEAKRAALAQARAQSRRRAVGWSVAGLVVVALFVALIAYIVRQGDVSEVGGEGQLDLAVASDNGGIPVGAEGVVGQDVDPSRVRLDVYFDFICPACGGFEQMHSETMSELRAEGILDVYYHPIATLDRTSLGTKYSTRAASAAALVGAESPTEFLAFMEAMFVNQPAEGTEGLTDEQIQAIASQVGVADVVVARIPDHEYESWVRVSTETAREDGLLFTPTIAINGEMQNPRDNPGDLNWTVEGAFEQAIRDADGGE